MGAKRVQVILEEEEREAFRRQAVAEGVSLSAWLRAAGRRRLESQARQMAPTVEGVRQFFTGLADESGPEPDWQEHRRVIETSRREGLAST